MSTDSLKEVVSRAVPGSWVEHPNYWAVACDYESGRRTPFGRVGSPRAEIGDAVAASCAIPGFFRPVKIGGRRYVDGGVCSVSNLDLVAGRGLDLVICLNPLTSRRRGRVRRWRRARPDPRDHPARLARPARARGAQGAPLRHRGRDHRADRRGPRRDGSQLDERRAPPGRDRDRRAHRGRAAARPGDPRAARAACRRASRTRSAARRARPRAGPRCGPPQDGRHDHRDLARVVERVRARGGGARRGGRGERVVLARAHGRPADRRGRPGGAAPRAERRPRRARSRLHPRDAARALDAREPLLPGGRARAPEHPGGGPGAARGQPLRRQPHARHARVHARVQHLLRGRAPLPPARPQPRAVDARASGCSASTAPWRPRPRTPSRRSTRRGAARLPGRRLRGAPADLGVRARGLRRPPRLHPAGEVEGRAARPGGRDRRPGDRAVPLARRGHRAAARHRPHVPAEGAADLARAARGA